MDISLGKVLKLLTSNFSGSDSSAIKSVWEKALNNSSLFFCPELESSTGTENERTVSPDETANILISPSYPPTANSFPFLGTDNAYTGEFANSLDHNCLPESTSKHLTSPFPSKLLPEKQRFPLGLKQTANILPICSLNSRI